MSIRKRPGPIWRCLLMRRTWQDECCPSGSQSDPPMHVMLRPGSMQGLPRACAVPLTAGDCREAMTGSLVMAILFHSSVWALTGLLLTRSEEHTSELQYRMRISYAVVCSKNKTDVRIDWIRCRTSLHTSLRQP